MNLLESQLKALVSFLSKERIKYAILGGIAVAIYGEPRMTADVDVNILFDRIRIGDFLKKARRYGFYPSLPNAKKIARETGVVPMGLKKGKIDGKFDFIIAENILELMSIKRGKPRMIGRVKAKFVSPEDLIVHKISSARARDLEDVRGILMRQRGRLDSRYIRLWLKKIDKANKGSQLYKLFNRLLKEV